MIRFKYVTDEKVFINDSYTVSYDDFVQDCLSLNMQNPLTKGEHLLYTPSRGIETINAENHHGKPDEENNSAMELIITSVDDFVLACKARLNPPLTTDQKWDILKAKCNALLLKTDWTMLLDSPLTDSQKASYVSYRAALRDLKNNTTDIGSVTWPIEPS